MVLRIEQGHGLISLQAKPLKKPPGPGDGVEQESISLAFRTLCQYGALMLQSMIWGLVYAFGRSSGYEDIGMPH